VLFCLLGVVGQQRMSDVAEVGAGQCDQAVRAAFSQPFFAPLHPHLPTPFPPIHA